MDVLIPRVWSGSEETVFSLTLSKKNMRWHSVLLLTDNNHRPKLVAGHAKVNVWCFVGTAEKADAVVFFLEGQSLSLLFFFLFFCSILLSIQNELCLKWHIQYRMHLRALCRHSEENHFFTEPAGWNFVFLHVHCKNGNQCYDCNEITRMKDYWSNNIKPLRPIIMQADQDNFYILYCNF